MNVSRLLRWAVNLFLVAGLILVVAACSDEDDDGDKTTPTSEPAVTVEAQETPTQPADDDHAHDDGEEISFDAASATITVDGDNSDWAGIEGTTIPLEQIEIPEGLDWDEPSPLDPIDVTLKVATDADNIYVLLEVPDDYDFNLEDHNLSPSPNLMFRIDEAAAPHMGAGDEDLETSLGIVDIWHWEIDCDAGVMSGGGDAGSGDDPDCNLDDEFAATPEDREDDGGGDVANPNAENSLAGVWEHTARAQGAGADGTWIFEISRPVQTGDSEDAQFASGGAAHIAIAYFDPDEGAEGWTDNGHLVSAEAGWIEVILP
jgi:phage baseplate assembly protein gpV